MSRRLGPGCPRNIPPKNFIFRLLFRFLIQDIPAKLPGYPAKKFGFPGLVACFAAALRWRFRISKVSQRYRPCAWGNLGTRIAAFSCHTNRSVKLPSFEHFQDQFFTTNKDKWGKKKDPVFRNVCVFELSRAVGIARFEIRIRIATASHDTMPLSSLGFEVLTELFGPHPFTWNCDPNGLLENRFRAFGPKQETK